MYIQPKFLEKRAKYSFKCCKVPEAQNSFTFHQVTDSHLIPLIGYIEQKNYALTVQLTQIMAEPCRDRPSAVNPQL